MWKAAMFDYIRERGQMQDIVNKGSSGEESNRFWFYFSTIGYQQPRFCLVLGAAGVQVLAVTAVDALPSASPSGILPDDTAG